MLPSFNFFRNELNREFLECGNGPFDHSLIGRHDVQLHKVDGFQQPEKRIGTNEVVESDPVACRLQLCQPFQHTVVRLNAFQELKNDSRARERFTVVTHDHVSAEIDKSQLLPYDFLQTDIHERVQDHFGRGLIAIGKGCVIDIAVPKQ